MALYRPSAAWAQIGNQESNKKNRADTPSKSWFSSIRPLPTPPPPPKGTPLTINTHDIEQYVQPLYARGWELPTFGTLPNGNGVAMLRKRFKFANAEALEGFLADLSEYEERKAGPFSISLSIARRIMCLRINTPSSLPHGRTSLEEGQKRK